jgi:Starch-binding associating with outer membrane
MKKNIKKALFGITMVSALAFSSCKKLEDFGNTDIRQDASTIPLPSGLFTSALSNLGGTMTGLTSGLRSSLYCQYFAEEQYTEQSTYAAPQVDFSANYTGPLMDLKKVIDLNTNAATKGTVSVLSSGANENQIGVARIISAYLYWTITDRWGDIPYKSALQGVGSLSPKYDTQESIYKDLLKELKEASTQLDDTKAKIVGDYFYNGDNAKWRKLANSVRMLIALRMSKVYPNASELAATEFVAAANATGGTITANAENFTATYTGENTVATNPWYNTLNGRKDYDISKTFADILSNMADGRLAVVGSAGSAMPYGLTRDNAIAFSGTVNGNISRPFANRSKTASVVIVSAASVLLAQAEAVERGWWAAAPKTAQQYYEDGVTASFDQWAVSGAATYLAGAASFSTGAGGGSNIGASTAFPSIVGADANTTTALQRIQLQRYLASFGDGIQAWAEWRRTGVPNLKPTAYGTNSPKEIPRRFIYPVSEYATNTSNVNDAAARYQGGDLMNSKMWWDK